MKILSNFFILFVGIIMLCSCDKEEYYIYYIMDSYNNNSVNINDSTKTNKQNTNTDTNKKGTISFGVSDVEQG